MDVCPSPLISAEDLARALAQGAPRLKLVDGSFALPGTDPTPHESFLKERIGKAVFFDIDAVADRDTDLPHMLPASEDFARAVSGLGLSSDDTLVVYGQSGSVMGPARVWWTFHVFGHENIRVLDGGLPRWKALGLPTETGAPETPPPGRFAARFRAERVIDRAGVAAGIKDKSIIVLDARAALRFEGTAPEPRPGLQSGHIPGSVNLPCVDLVDAQTGLMKSPESLREILDSCGAHEGVPVVATCGSGVTACMIALALAVVGRPEARVYDGSWAEWGRGSLPVARGK
jgi:thiosulfate/3-mercaptopyruvate sulfurtransferase